MISGSASCRISLGTYLAFRGFLAALTPANDLLSLLLKSRGFNVLMVSDGVKKTLAEVGVKQTSDVLNDDDLNGRLTDFPTKQMLCVFNLVWDQLVQLKMTAGKPAPQIAMFRQVSESTGTMRGYYKDNCVYIKEDYANDKGLELQHIMLHEIVHHITGAMDYTVDFQEFAVKLACKLLFSK